MFKRFLLANALFTLIAAAIHAGIVYSNLFSLPVDYGFLAFYVLLFVLLSGLIYVVNYVREQNNHKMGMAYIVTSMVKMLVCLVFLLPIIYGGGEYVYIRVLQFLLVYLVYMFFELFWVFRLLKR